MTDTEQRTAARAFAKEWKGKGYEKGESQAFWLALIRNIFGIDKPEQFIIFEEQVKLDHTSFIDVIIPATHVMIEQKGLGKDLRKPIRQSDGTLLTPFQQAKRYSSELPYSRRPRWIVTCNFSTFLVYDMENPAGEPEEILLENLEREYYRLSFLVDTGNAHLKREMEISIQAGDIVGVLYDAILKQHGNLIEEYLPYLGWCSGGLPIEKEANQPLTLVAKETMPGVTFYLFVIGAALGATATILNSTLSWITKSPISC